MHYPRAPDGCKNDIPAPNYRNMLAHISRDPAAAVAFPLGTILEY